jgi:glycosyltransferase involved in cell wall biosynthesis
MTDDPKRTLSKGNGHPLISVVLPVYNGETHLAEAIESILAQTFTNFELIMIDDGSTDRTLQILRKYEQIDARVRVVARENRGLPATLNDSIDIACGKLIARMDHDDVCHPNRLACQYDFMQQHLDVVALGSAANFMDVEGSAVCTYLPPTDDTTLRQMFPGSPFVHPSVMFRKNAFYTAGKYPEKMKWGGEDVVFFGRLAKFGSLRNLSERLINYRLVPGSMSRKPPKFRNMLASILADEIEGNLVAGERLEALQEEAKKIDKSQVVFDYHFEVAKLYTWSGSPRDKSMKHLKKCLAFRTSIVKVIFLYLLALMPQRWVSIVYFRMKGRRYER